MSKKAKDKVFELVEEQGVKFLRLQFTDIQGIPKNVAIPASKLDEALEGGVAFDGSSIEGFVRIEESDMRLMPDPETYALLPWRPRDKAVARLICDVTLPSGEPFMGCPRNVLKRQLEKAEEMGYTMKTGPELEFFLFEKDDEGKPTTNTHDVGGYFDFAPVDLAEDIRREIILGLESMNFDIEASHHEVAEGQHEIDFRYGDALTTADRAVTFKLVTKTMALRCGLHATFMAKPIHGINGTGMHTNISLFDGDENAFYDPSAEGEISDTARYFIGGLLNHVKAVTAVANPTVNSYKRLVPGYEAPVYISWSLANRSSLIRVPSGRKLSTRIEFRSPDPTCNPYLAFAAILAAGMNGIRNKIDPDEPVELNIYDMSEREREEMGIESLPGSLEEALKALEQDEVIRKALCEHVYNNFLRMGWTEWDLYRTKVHDWELDRYLTKF